MNCCRFPTSTPSSCAASSSSASHPACATVVLRWSLADAWQTTSQPGASGASTSKVASSSRPIPIPFAGPMSLSSERPASPSPSPSVTPRSLQIWSSRSSRPATGPATCSARWRTGYPQVPDSFGSSIPSAAWSGSTAPTASMKSWPSSKRSMAKTSCPASPASSQPFCRIPFMGRPFVVLLAALAMPAVAPAQGDSTAAPDPIAQVVARLDLERYKATIKGLTAFGDRRQGTDRNRAAADWIEAQLRSYGCSNVARLTYEYQPASPPSPGGRGGQGVRTDERAPFQDYAPAISLRENERGTQIGAGWDPNWHQPTDRYATYGDKDFRLGLNAAQTTLGAIAGLVGATIK